MASLVECIPNFSEGCRTEVIDQLVNVIESVQGCAVLHRTSDQDHNRSVITFAGTPDAVVESAYRAIQLAAEKIDLNHHRGVHPRIGATDVVPFVPLSGVTMQDCVALANRLAERVSADLGIPVYLYEHAARRPERRDLANLRRGQYEGLKEIIDTPERLPDYGPAHLGSAGATVIGARDPLIAYNVYLNTDDVKIARMIARTIRFSSGGLPGVKALGLIVNDRAQISMNLTDYQRTPLPQVMENIRREALRHGTSIHHSELIGLIPEDAIMAAVRWYLMNPDLNHDRILENRLRELL